MERLRFGVTTNAGMERFAVEEATRFLRAENTHSSQGFVSFECEGVSILELLQLRTVERVYVEIGYLEDVTVGLFGSKDAEHCMDMIAHSVSQKQWDAGTRVWRQATGLSEEKLPNPDFRASCKRMGALSKHMKSPEIAAHVGVSLRKRFGWKVSLRDYDAEVYIRVTDTFAFTGICLTRERLTDRKDQLREKEGLRGSIAFAMAMLSGLLECNPATTTLEVGERASKVVIDPMCGKGALLLEASRCLGDGGVVVGSDMSNGQLRAAIANVATTHTSSRIHLMKADATNLPLDTGSVDAILCDLPFGKKFGSEKGNKQLYPSVLKEFRRVLRPTPGATATMLTSKRQVQTLISACKKNGFDVASQSNLKIGNTDACIIVAHPTETDS